MIWNYSIASVVFFLKIHHSNSYFITQISIHYTTNTIFKLWKIIIPLLVDESEGFFCYYDVICEWVTREENTSVGYRFLFDIQQCSRSTELRRLWIGNVKTFFSRFLLLFSRFKPSLSVHLIIFNFKNYIDRICMCFLL